jgi:hypothetical protein
MKELTNMVKWVSGKTFQLPTQKTLNNKATINKSNACL